MKAKVYDWNHKIGVIYISSSVTLEWEWHIALPENISVHAVRIGLGTDETGTRDCTKESLWDMVSGPQIEQEALKLKEAEVDVIAFCCTSGSFIGGKGADQKIVERIEKATGIPATSTSSALLEALAAIKSRHLAAVTPYIDEINVVEKKFLADNGFHADEIKGLQMLKDQEMGRVMPQQFCDLMETIVTQQTDSLFISCTNSRTIEAITTLEEHYNLPTLSSNQVTLWKCLKMLGYMGPVYKYGRLFQLL